MIVRVKPESEAGTRLMYPVTSITQILDFVINDLDLYKTQF